MLEILNSNMPKLPLPEFKGENEQYHLGVPLTGRAIRSNLFCLAGQKRIYTSIPNAKFSAL